MSVLALNGGRPVRTTPFPRWPWHDETDRAMLLETLESGLWSATDGELVARFEEAWGGVHGLGGSLACTNGTHAIELALEALGIGEGDEVIVPDYTFLATASAVVTVNAVPILADIEPTTLCLDPASVEACITPRTVAVIAVHLAGHPADLDRLGEICRRHGLALIEDCAHAHGSEWNGRRVGTFGDAGTHSFQQSKLMTAGEGGAVVATDPEVLAAARSFGDCGRRPGGGAYDHHRLGSNMRMTEWQAAVLLAQLDRFHDQNEQRNANAAWLSETLTEIPGVEPQTRDRRTTSQGYYCYVFRIHEQVFGADADRVRRALAAEGIPRFVSYQPIHTLETFVSATGFGPRHKNRAAFPRYSDLSLSESTRAAEETVWVWHPFLLSPRDEVADLATALRKIRENVDELEALH